MRGVAIPFTEEEIERLADLAEAEGGTIGEYVRLCVFGPQREVDPVALVAEIEGRRIRGARWLRRRRR